jgi:hypothetical protein
MGYPAGLLEHFSTETESLCAKVKAAPAARHPAAENTKFPRDPT